MKREKQCYQGHPPGGFRISPVEGEEKRKEGELPARPYECTKPLTSGPCPPGSSSLAGSASLWQGSGHLFYLPLVHSLI